MAARDWSWSAPTRSLPGISKNDAASHSAYAFVDQVGTSDPVRIVTGDITAIKRTMRVRSPHAVWAKFTDTPGPLPWLESLPLDVSLIDIDQRSWNAGWADRLAAPADALLGPCRNLAVVAKVLHAKRLRMYPVLGSLVVQLLGGSGKPARELLDRVRQVGRMSEPTLRLISSQLRQGDTSLRRTRVRILDGILWTADPGSSPEYEQGAWGRGIAWPPRTAARR